MKGEDATAVIELKGTDTTDLDKIETQAFGYKNHHPKCKYVITSNFEKLRFYIQNAVDHIDFDLFNLTQEQFSLLWLCLAKDNLLNGFTTKNQRIIGFTGRKYYQKTVRRLFKIQGSDLQQPCKKQS